MTMGSRIRAARLERGLSQRQLAGDEITRNMLSALEHDGANPSVSTLKYLSEKLDKPISYFLGEEAPGEAEIAQARDAYRDGRFRACLDALEGVREEAFRSEKGLLAVLASMGQAEQAIREGRYPYARELLDRAWERAEGELYFDAPQRRRWMLLYARCGGPLDLPDEDEALLLRAEAALAAEDPDRALRLLEAAEERNAHWNYLRGEIHFRRKEYAQAARCFHACEDDYPVLSRLEDCYRELEDYKMAYFYAKKKEENR